MSQPSLYFYDLETWGANPQKDQACQFAGIRTDFDLNIIDSPLELYCQINNDCLPNPHAVMVTGITPQQTQRDGLIEAEFIDKIHQAFSQPNTCVLGYNSLRFDDEVIRHALYRNFYDPYAREWQHGNSRWDIIDMLRTCYALRPDGINWPLNDEGVVSFKLEKLTQANGIEHQDAHDAMSDVYATIAMAKLVKQKQPKLFNYLFELRNKKLVAAQLDWQHFTPVVHISSKLAAANGCCTWIVPVALHPTNKNAVICLNLGLDPRPLLELSAEQIKQKLYQPSELLAEGEQRLPIKLLHMNKCPVVAPAKTLTQENAERLGIDRDTCLTNLDFIKAHPQITSKLQHIYELEEPVNPVDADFGLYSGGFASAHDKQLFERIRQAPAESLVSYSGQFEDHRFNTLLFRYRARNYPNSLQADELNKWQQHRQFRLMDTASPASIKLDEYMQLLETLAQEHHHSPDKLALLKALYQYAENL